MSSTLSFDRLGGINLDRRGDWNQMVKLRGLSPNEIKGYLSLAREIKHSGYPNIDGIYLGIYISTTHGKCLLYVQNSGSVSLLRISDGQVIDTGFNLPFADDWDGVQVDTRFYIQSRSLGKRYLFRYDDDEKFLTGIVITKDLSVIEAYTSAGKIHSGQDSDYLFNHSFKVAPFLDGNFGAVKEYIYKDENKLTPALGLKMDGDYYVFHSASSDNSFPEENLLYTVIDGKQKITVADYCRRGDNLGALYNVSSPTYTIFFDRKDSILYRIFANHFNGLANFINATVKINGQSYNIVNVNAQDDYIWITLGQEVDISATLQVNVIELSFDIQDYSFAVAFDSVTFQNGYVKGDLISNYVDLSREVEAYGLSSAYYLGVLVIGSPKYDDKEYDSYLTYSEISGRGVSQILRIPAKNMISLGSYSGKVKRILEKFGRLFVFSEGGIAILAMDNEINRLVLRETIQVGVADKYHVASALDGIYLFSSGKIYRIDQSGLSEVEGINKALLNATNVSLAYDNVLDALYVYVDGINYVYEKGNWRSESGFEFIDSVYNQKSYYITRSGAVYYLDNTYVDDILFETDDLIINEFMEFFLNEIRLNGRFEGVDLYLSGASLIVPDDPPIALKPIVDTPGRIVLKVNRNLRNRIDRMRLRFVVTGSLTKFDLRNIDLSGNFVRMEGVSDG